MHDNRKKDRDFTNYFKNKEILNKFSHFLKSIKFKAMKNFHYKEFQPIKKYWSWMKQVGCILHKYTLPASSMTNILQQFRFPGTSILYILKQISKCTILKCQEI